MILPSPFLASSTGDFRELVDVVGAEELVDVVGAEVQGAR
jgi:hypothetical protein